MHTADFLRAIWPSTGPYCLAYQFHPKNSPADALAWAHVVKNTVEEVTAYIDGNKNAKNLYYAMFSLRAPSMFDPEKLDRKTGQLGKNVVRTQANMLATKCYFFDLDVGPTKPYPSQAAAVGALKSFLADTQLPAPMVVSSGNGIHVYWLLDAPLAADAWLPTAASLKQLAGHHSLKVDASRTTDVASVLRPTGSLNIKDPLNPKPVRVLAPGPVTQTKRFQRAVSDAQARTGLPVTAAPKTKAPSLFGKSNLETEYAGPPVTLPELAAACGQVRELLRSQKTPTHTHHNLDNNAWYHAMNVVRWVDDGDNWCRKITQANPRTRSDVDEKLAQLAKFAPAKCQTVRDHMPWGDSPCASCPNAAGLIGPNPLVVARRSTQAPAPVLQQVVFGAPVQVQLPDPPKPYTRLKSGGVAFAAEDSEGNIKTTQIYPYDLYPVRRLTNADNDCEQQVWCVDLPRESKKEFMIDAPAMYDTRKFTEAIANQGIYPHKAHIPYLQDYMVAYINELQKLIDAEEQTNHLGWSAQYHEFILPDVTLVEDGTTKVSSLGLGARRSTEHVRKAGTLEGQAALMSFYNRPEYLSNQLFVLGSLAAPIFYMTDKHGVIVNASGVAGSSKSTTLYTATAFWGDPEQYAINGTNSGATARARNERVTTLANLPICVDEITHLPTRDAVDLAMGITQPGHRLRLQSDGIERKASGAYKATIMLTTANSSLHGVLSTDNTAGTAGSMRVFEMEFRHTRVHSKAEADAYLRELKKNFGHLGPALVQYVVKNRAKVEARVHAVMAEIDRAANIQPSERYWSAYLAAAVVAGELAVALGLIPYNIVAVREHAIEYLIPRMRGVVQDEYSDPLSIMADYLESIQGNMLWVKSSDFNGTTTKFVHRHPHGPLCAHYDMADDHLFVLKKGFKSYCAKIGANALDILEMLHQPHRTDKGDYDRIVLDKNARKVLGAGTDYAKTQSYCFVVNMASSQVTGGIDRKILTGEAGLPGPADNVISLHPRR